MTFERWFLSNYGYDVAKAQSPAWVSSLKEAFKAGTRYASRPTSNTSYSPNFNNLDEGYQ